jgi:hypothetical protein
MEEQTINLIALLNHLAFNVVKIEEEYFVFQIFEPASQYNPDSTLKGQDITKFIKDNLLLYQGNALQQQDQIYSKIEQLPKVIRRYSNHYKYIIFLAR